MQIGKLLDFQKYEQNKNMSKIVDDVEDRYYKSSKRKLSLDEMSYVAAAGANSLNDDEDIDSNKFHQKP